MYLCSAASGYSRWKFKCIGFVLNGIDYCAVLVRGNAEPYISTPSQSQRLKADSSKHFSESDEDSVSVAWTLTSASAPMLLSYDLIKDESNLWMHKVPG